MRMIGHEILLCLGDQESRVLPVEKMEELYGADSYRISFEREFGFEPSDVVTVVDRVMTEAGITNHYFVEVQQCETKEMVYSYEINDMIEPELSVCFGRILPPDCYSLIITLLDDNNLIFNQSNPSTLTSSATLKANLLKSALVIIAMLSMVGLIGFLIQKKEPVESDPNMVLVGASQFDKRSRALSFEDTSVELSHKEAELLSLLHSSANAPLKREFILQEVWGDEGAYIGRTLDVFISKLRKKLEADASVKIVNIRGVGYQLVMNV